jgi:chromosomal replication initiation ATPase DnaA
MWMVRRAFGYSYPELGRIFGRDHSTCIVAVRKVDRAIETGRPLRLAEIARGMVGT